MNSPCCSGLREIESRANGGGVYIIHVFNSHLWVNLPRARLCVCVCVSCSPSTCLRSLHPHRLSKDQRWWQVVFQLICVAEVERHLIIHLLVWMMNYISQRPFQEWLIIKRERVQVCVCVCFVSGSVFFGMEFYQDQMMCYEIWN